jgi:hypothetical protein
MSNRVGLRRLLIAVLFVVCVCAVVGTALAAGPGRGAGEQRRLAELLKREGAVAQLARGPGSVSGRELVVGADWLSVGDPASEGETVEFWGHPRRGVRDRDRRVTLGWGASSVRFRTALAPGKWSHVSVSWDEAGVRLDLDGQTIESYGLGEPSGVAEPHRLSVGRGALTSAPRWVALYNSSIDVRSVVRHYRAALPLMRPVADPPANRSGRVVAHAAALPANTVLPAISGTAKDGQTLTSTTGTWTGSPTSYVRQWLRCDTAGANCTNISGATSTTYVLTATDVGKTIRVKVTATNGSGSANVNSAQTATVVAAAPVVSAVPTISGTAKDGQTLTSTTGTWSGTPTITYARQWNRCNSGGTGCVAISGAAGTTYVVTTADIGSKLQVTVTASNAAGSASSSSVVTALVVGAVPANTVVPTISGTAKEGQLLSATAGTWTGSAPITYGYQWQSCTPTCTNISSATAATYRLVAAQVGKTIKVVVTATNSTGSASATGAATATVTTGVPVNTALPVVTGTTTDGQALSSTTGTWAGTATITYARQWKRCDGTGANCTNISGATGTTYTLTSPDVGKVIKLTVTATNGVGNTSADAATTAVVAGIAPVNTAVPTVTGTAQDTHQLTAGTGTWTGSTPITYSYQWKRCDGAGANCTDISGATGSTYMVVSADVGATVVVSVTASNGAGSASASTVATAVVAAAAPANTVLPTISGSATDGTELAASPGTWSGTVPITYTYQWQHCTSPGSSCQAIEDETDSSYVVDSDYVGESIRVEVTATNAVGNDAAMSTQTAPIAAVPRSQTDPMVVDGLTMVGRTLSLNVGGWAGTGPITFQYQWQRCDSAGANCLNISGASQNSYALTEEDLGSRMRVVGMVFSPSSSASSYTSPTSAVVTGATETVESDMTPVAEPLDPTDDEHIEQTAEIINRLGPYYSPATAPCNALCESAAADIQALAASLPPEDNVFGPMSKTSGVNLLLASSDTTQQIVRGAGEAIIGAALVPVEVPTVVAIGVAAAVVGVVVYSGVIGGPRYSKIDTIARAGEVPVCGQYPEYATPCPIIGAKSVYYPQGFTISADGATMPYDGYVYTYMVTTSLGYVNALATCANYQGLPQAAPAEFVDRVNEGSTTLCTDMHTHAPNTIAIAPGSLHKPDPFTYTPTAPPAAPGDVQMGVKPGWPGPGSFGSIQGRVKESLQDEALKRQLAHAENPRCNPSPTADTVTVPAIQEGESGQHYASCLKTLGLDPSVRVRPIADADTSKDPGAALSGSQDAGTELDPDAPVTVIVNPGPTGDSADAAWLRDIEAGLIAHNPELVETIPEFETEIVPVVALQCAKNVKLAEAFAAQEGVDSTASEEDCGDEENAGLPMYISGNTTPQATQNDINALKRNPLWTSLNRRLVPNGPGVPPAWKFTTTERQWYKHPPTPGCTKPTPVADPVCDEFPYFATLQGQFGLLKTETPHTEFVHDDDNALQGSLLSKFYLAGGPGVHPWYGCDVHGHPRTDAVAIPASRFLALPNENIPTIGICNKPRATP